MKARLSRIFFQLFCITTLTICFSMAYAADAAQYDQPDRYWREGSYQLAAQGFKAFLDAGDLSEGEKAEVSFKYADALWRTGKNDGFKEAEDILKELSASKGQPRWKAEAEESLAHFYQTKDRWSHQQDIIDHFQSARDYWAGATDINEARPRFIKLSFDLGDYLSQNWGWSYNGIRPTKLSGNIKKPDQNTGLDTLYKEVLKVAKSDTDKAKAHYFLAMSIMHRDYSKEGRSKALKAFEKVITDHDASEWVDDSYYNIGQLYENMSDFPKAVEAYRQLMARFSYGTSKWSDDAKRRIEYITKPQLNMGVGYTFIPGSEIQFSLNWRNVSGARFDIYKFDMVDQLIYREGESLHNRGIDNYRVLIEQLVKSGRLQSLDKVKSWSRKLKNDNKHMNHNANMGLAEWLEEDDAKNINFENGKLPAGAYLILVTAGSLKVYDLILVSDMGLVAKVAGDKALFYAIDGKDGKPKPGVRLKYHYRYYDNSNNWVWESGTGVTGEDGLLEAALKTNNNANYGNQHNVFVTASDGTMQSFAQANYYNYTNMGNWWLYAYTDRPAYRPNELVSFKGIVRNYNGETFINPDGKQVRVYIYDPQGNRIKDEVYTLNAYGTFSDSFTLDEKAPLGQYRLELRNEQNKDHLASAALFRLEEYKLPEYQVTVSPKDPEDGKFGYRLGDEVEVEIDAQYYFGGAVADAEVTYLVYQQAYHHTYHKPRKYSWYYDAIHQPYYYGGNGTLIKQETIRTDADGKARFTFETPEDNEGNLKYKVEARVVDKSRREIVGSAEIKVTKNSYFAYLDAQRHLYRPGDKAKIDIKTMTANDKPVSVEGKVSIIKNTWREVEPKSPSVKEEKASRSLGSVRHDVIHPPVPPKNYVEEEVFTKFVKTNDKGEAVFEFEPHEDGYYVVKFTGFDEDGEIVSTAHVYVCDKQSTDIGYRYGGLQIIAESDTYQPGETARLMLVSDRPDTYVLFSVEADGIYDHRLIHIENIVKLIEVPVTTDYTPNIFFVALSGADYQIKTAQLPVVVPPEEKFLNVKIISDKEEYQPQEEGEFIIEVTDHKGNPVSGEVSLGVVDKSVYYIQSELVDDIRKYFYGNKRNLSVQTQLSYYQRRQVMFKRDDKNEDLVSVDLLKVAKDKGRREGEMDERQSLASGNVQGIVSMNQAPASAELKSVGASRAKKESRFADADMIAEESLSAPARGEPAGGSGQLDTPSVRTDFRSTVFWQPSVITDTEGRAVIKTKFSDSLTSWKTTARAITPGTAIGQVTHEVRTKKDLIVRLQGPRFFTERDKVTISAIVNNYSDEAQKVKVTLEPEGLKLKDKAEVWVTVEPGAEKRVDWQTVAVKAGYTDITVMAQSESISDAMRKRFTIIPHGIEKFIAESTALKGGSVNTQTLTFNVPKERIKESTQLDLVLSPSMAAAMLDALPYLAEYPYGCVEQTMSRFLPAVIVVSTMRELGISDNDIAAYMNTVMGDAWHPKGVPGQGAPTLEKLDEMVEAGLKRLYDFQHSDGGWGWWKDDTSNRFMSSYVLWGLSLAKDAGVKVNSSVISKAQRFLQVELVQEEDNADMLAWMLHALAQSGSNSNYENKQRERLWEMRNELNAYTRALYALSEHFRGNTVNAETLARNVINGLEEDKENGTAHWGKAGIHYRWSSGGIEATAMSIKALVNIDPQSEYVAPSVKWLALNRRGARWKNTRDTAIAVLALADYLKTTNEFNPEYSYEIKLNGKTVKQGNVDPSNVLSFDRTLTLDADMIKDGRNTVEISLNGRGSLYAAGYLKYFTLEEGITAEGNEVFVERSYKYTANKETLLKGYVEEWKELSDGDELISGDRVKVEIDLEAKNHYEYLIVEDYKPAGFEAVELKSGTAWAEVLDKDGFPTGERVWMYQEFRDEKVVFFITKLPQGTHRLTYELRAEVPGEFHGMPNQTHAMYVPEIRANSDESQFSIVDK